jgi:hypothetical protein
MPLPKIDMPLYDLTIPSNGEKLKYRPFTVKEEKIMLMARESEDPKEIISAIKQIVSNCIFGAKLDDLALFDLEYIILNIRSRSVDNVIKFEITDPDTEEKIPAELDLRNVEIQKNEDHKNKIKISNDYTLYLKYPHVDDFFELLMDENPSQERQFEILISCMDKLASEEDVYNFKDFSKEEIDDFIESLNADTLREMKNFFDTMPTARHEVPYVNNKGENKTFVIQGTQSFFI